MKERHEAGAAKEGGRMHRTIRRLRRRLFLVAFALPLFGSGYCVYFAFSKKVVLTSSQCNEVYGAQSIECENLQHETWIKLSDGTWLRCDFPPANADMANLDDCVNTGGGVRLTQQQSTIMNKLFPPEGSNTETPGVSEPVITDTPTTPTSPPPPKPR
jgi:hypothetical protein